MANKDQQINDLKLRLMALEQRVAQLENSNTMYTGYFMPSPTIGQPTVFCDATMASTYKIEGTEQYNG